MKIFICVVSTFLFFSCADDSKGLDREEQTTMVSADSSYNPEATLDSLGIVLRKQVIYGYSKYVHAVRSGNLLFLAGKGPKQANGENITGKLREELALEDGYAAAREVGVNQLSVLKVELGNLNRVKPIVSVHGMLNAVSDFKDHSKVINGFPISKEQIQESLKKDGKDIL